MKRSFVSRSLLVTAVLFSLGGCGESPTRESTGEAIDDSVITTKVKSVFVEDKNVGVFDIKVKTYKGVVQLSGFVNDSQESWKAAELARNVKGVKDVRNDIAVK